MLCMFPERYTITFSVAGFALSRTFLAKVRREGGGEELDKTIVPALSN